MGVEADLSHRLCDRPARVPPQKQRVGSISDENQN